MASKSNKEKAQKLVDKAGELLKRIDAEPENKTQLAQQALELMNEAIALDEENDQAWSNRGAAKHNLGDYEGAINGYNEAIRLNPENVGAWSNRGAARYALGDHRGARDDYTEAIRLNPENDSAWNNRGSAKNDLGDYQEAIDDCNEAIRLNPKNDSAWNNRGSVKNALGDHRGAIDDCNEAIRLNPKNDAAWINRGAAKHNLGDPQGAIDDIDDAIIKLNSKNDVAWGIRGAAKYDLGDHQGAMDDYNEAIRLNPENDGAWNNRGFAKYRLEQYEEAIKDYDEALRLNPDNKTIQKNRSAADIASKRNKTEDAYGQREKIISALSKSIDEQKNRSNWFRRVQVGLLAFLFAIIVLFFLLVFGFIECILWVLCFSDHNIIQIFGGHSDTANPLRFFPVFSILGFIIMPIIWGLRITGQAIMQSSILEQDYFSRLNVMNSLEYYESELGKDRNDLIIDHIKNWMNDNTADRMERLYSKKTDAGKTPHEDMMKLCEKMIDKHMKKAGNATKTGTNK